MSDDLTPFRKAFDDDSRQSYADVMRFFEQRVEDTIADMELGQVGWTVPWAICVDVGGQVWIRGDYAIHNEQSPSHQTIQLRVERLHDGVAVTVPRGYKWSAEEMRNEYLRDWKCLLVLGVKQGTWVY